MNLKNMNKYYALLNDTEILYNFLNVILSNDNRTTKEKMIDNIDLNKLKELRKTSMNNKEIANYFKVHETLIKYIVKEYDLPKRNKYF